MLILFSIALLQIQATGLGPGESVTELAPVVSMPTTDLRYGRIVDAFTGLPVAGATVETWTEETDADMGGFFRIGEGTSGQDGCFAVEGNWGQKRAEKVRVQAAGYCTLSMALGDISNSVVLFPAPDQPARLRVVDVHDRPIPGVLITSTYTCAHDVPAFSERTDAQGWASLASYGLQDEVPTLRLRAPGYETIKYLDGDEVLFPAQDFGALTVRLKQRSAITYTLLTKEGEPWADASLKVINGDGYHVLRSAVDGRFTIDSPYDGSTCDLYLLRSPKQRYLATVPTVTGVELKIRDGASDWPAQTPTGMLVIEHKNWNPRHVWAWNPDGWLHEVSKDEYAGFEFPAGPGFLLMGGAFTGIAPAVLPFDLSAEETAVVVVTPTKEPRVRVIEPEGDDSSLWVQSGGQTLLGAPYKQPFPVPTGQEVCFLFEQQGEVRRVCIDAATEGQVIDLRPEETIIQPKPFSRVVGIPPTPGTQTFLLPSQTTIAVTSPRQNCNLGERDGNEQIVTGTVGSPYLIQLQTDGCLPTWYRGHIGSPMTPQSARSLEPLPYATLKLTADNNFTVVGFDSEDLKTLSPGPLNLVLQFEDGSRLGLNLELQPGQQRTIEVKH